MLRSDIFYYDIVLYILFMQARRSDIIYYINDREVYMHAQLHTYYIIQLMHVKLALFIACVKNNIYIIW